MPAITVPSCGVGSSAPAPVANRTTIEPGRAGLDDELTVPSSLRAAACPLPEESTVKMPGFMAATRMVAGSDLIPWVFNLDLRRGLAGEREWRYRVDLVGTHVEQRSGTPSKSTRVFASEVGKRPPASSPAATPVTGPMAFPKRVTISPGETRSGARLAAFASQPILVTGGGPAERSILVTNASPANGNRLSESKPPAPPPCEFAWLQGSPESRGRWWILTTVTLADESKAIALAELLPPVPPR